MLFSAHTIEVDEARAAGFRDLITKPFGIEVLERQVRALLGDWRTTPGHGQTA